MGTTMPSTAGPRLASDVRPTHPAIEQELNQRPLRRADDQDPIPYQARRTGDRELAGPPMRRAGDVPTRRATVSLVVPARNEARNIPWVFEQIPSSVDEVILVDGDSSDATVRMATHCLPTVRHVQQSGPGKGNALRTGFAAATGDYIVMIDADGSMSPAEIPHYVHFLDNGYDFVKGSRFVAGGGSLDLTRIRSLGNRALLTMVNRLYGTLLTDLCYGFCAFRRSLLDELDLSSSGFEIEAEMIVHALRAGLRIAEVPSLELPRRSGRSNLHAISDGRRVLRTLITERPGARVATRAARGE